MSDKTFRRLSELIHSYCGIKMPPSKRVMLEGRIQKRMRVLGTHSIEEYCEFLLSPKGMETELVHAIDAITTNKTDFFREPGHFDYLTHKALPDLVYNHGIGLRRPLHLWSAGCSTGEEPYTMAMVLSEFAERCPGFQFSILATDICTRVLETAQIGIYEHAKVEPVPLALRKKYLLRNKDRTKKLVKIAPEVKSLIRFRRINLVEDDFGIQEPIDIIFCRNVVIYFNRATQGKLLRRFCDQLEFGGYLFMGHSETLNGMSLPLVNLGTTIYKRL